MQQQLPEGTVTLLFTDVEGSTALRTSQGDSTGHARLQAHGEIVRGQLREHRGHEVKTMGDGFMAAFGSARSAVDCAVGIQRRLDEDNRSYPAEHQIRVRAGLHTGEVVREDGDLFGEAVNAAARIMAKATGGQILVSDTLTSILGHGGETALLDRGRFRLKGFPERWRLYEVLWRSKEEPAPAAAPVLAERTPFVGREAELAELRRLMEQALAGHGSIVLIRGEPGVGKTRLAQELVLEARKRGMFDSTGRCYEMEGAPPYIPYIEMLQQSLRRGPAGFRAALGEDAGEIAKMLPELRQVFDDIPPPLELPPEQERMYLFNSIREFLERVSHTLPLLHVLDDLHWADDATLLLLQHIAQHQDKMAVLTVVTYRDIELDAARPFARTLESLLRQRLARRIALKPLPEVGVEGMLRALAGQPPPPALIQAIYRETEGNPFFVEEVFQHLLEQGRLLDSEGHWRADVQVGELDVPEGVRLVISRRLERVSEECRTALTDAAVIGRDFGFDLLQKLSDLDADTLLDAIDEAERANLIVAADDVSVVGEHAVEARFRFAHELIRQTLISGLSLPRRQRLHLRVAETMELVYGKGAEAYAADMAHHLYQAGAGGDPAKTARYLVLAGDQAMHSAAFGRALRDYDAAFALQPAGDRAARADLFYKRGLARRSLDRWDEALADWREAADAYERLGNAEAAARAFESMCYQVLYGQHFTEALEISQRGLAAIGRRDSFYRARLLGWGGLTLSLAGFYSAGDAMLRRGQAIAVRLNDDELIGLGLSARATHHWPYLEVREAADAGLKSSALLRKTGQLWYLADTLFYTATSLTHAGRWEEISEIFRELTPLAERLGHTVWSGGHYDDFLVARTGDFDAAEKFWRQWLERARGRQHWFWASQGELFLGAISFWRGHWQEALNSLQSAAEMEPAGVFFGMPAAAKLLVNAYAGDKESALAALRVKGAAAARVRAEGPSAASLLLPVLRAARNSGLGLGGLVGLIRELRSLQTRGPLPRPGRPATFGESTMLFAAVEGLAVLGEKTEAAKLYPSVLERMKTGNIARPLDFRLLDTLAGIAAGAGGNWTQAEEHFRTALRRTEELPHIVEQPEVRRFYARMLLDRNAPDDREQAERLLTEAMQMYRRIGMPKHLEMAEVELRRAN